MGQGRPGLGSEGELTAAARMESFRAYRVHDDGRPGAGRVERMHRGELDHGNVVVRIAYAGVNYKDALTASGRAGMARKIPLVCGTDLTGVVESSDDPRFRPGAQVLIHSFGLGSRHDGGFAELGRFPAEWIFPLPAGLSLLEAAALGVAGHSVGVAIELLHRNGVGPESGKVLVNGATGGVGSIAIDVLSRLGYHVVALTGKAQKAGYLRSLGAAEVLERAKVAFEGRPLEAQQWAAAFDSVGGVQLEWLLRTARRDAVIAAIGNAAGNEFAGNVLPFILRGVRLIGINVNNPVAAKLRIWQRLATDWKPRHFEHFVRCIGLDDLPRAFDELLAGRCWGRQVVDPGKG
jgi:acrylyl-CoA reductase (NADPH)